MQEKEVSINARGLTNPGPRMMVESALAGQRCSALRVVVSSEEAVKDLEEYFDSLGVTMMVDRIGEEFHILVDLGAREEEST